MHMAFDHRTSLGATHCGHAPPMPNSRKFLLNAPPQLLHQTFAHWHTGTKTRSHVTAVKVACTKIAQLHTGTKSHSHVTAVEACAPGIQRRPAAGAFGAPARLPLLYGLQLGRCARAPPLHCLHQHLSPIHQPCSLHSAYGFGMISYSWCHFCVQLGLLVTAPCNLELFSQPLPPLHTIAHGAFSQGSIRKPK